MTMLRTPRLPAIAAALVMLWPPVATAAATTAPAPQPAPARLETSVSYTANLFHWVDNLAGTSVGKTRAIYQREWTRRFGMADEEDLAALRDFGRIRMSRFTAPVEVTNDTGCLPLEKDVLSWHKVMLSEAMQAASPEDLAARLSPPLDEPGRDRLLSALRRFEPRFRQVWEDLEHVRAFEGRFGAFLQQSGMMGYLAQVAAFFGVDPGAFPPMKVSFIGLPDNGPTHAEADGDHLLVEIRPMDRPEDQIQVVAHEASHFFMNKIPPARVDTLAREAHAESEAGALVWRYMWEGIPTSLGQGLAEARLQPGAFSTSLPWYHIASIDRFAKLIYPGVAETVAGGNGLASGLMGRMARVVGGSSLASEAGPAEFLMASFFAAGRRLDQTAAELRDRLRVGPTDGPAIYAISDPALSNRLRRYTCLGGVALLTAEDLPRMAALDPVPLLPPATVKEMVRRAERGDGAIAAGRRAGGGPVFFLVTPDPGEAGPVIEAFLDLRGIPSDVVPVKVKGRRGK